MRNLPTANAYENARYENVPSAALVRMLKTSARAALMARRATAVGRAAATVARLTPAARAALGFGYARYSGRA
jgi:hypothetical protein